jgi:hypothetical protein
MSKDPLSQFSDRQRELFERFTRDADGFSTEQVIGAAANLLVNALRQAHASRDGALDGFDQIAAKTRALIADHYDMMGRRRNVFPFNQVIDVPHINFSQRW